MQISGEDIPDRGSCRCKGPEVGGHLACSKNSKEDRAWREGAGECEG